MLVLTLALALAAPTALDNEARISIDVKDAEIADVARLLADVAGFQLVVDPGVSCRVSLRLKQVRWRTALDVSLRSCGLASDESDDVIRIATAARLTEQAKAERELQEARTQAAPRRLSTFTLSYARAREMAPLLKALSPRADVYFDERTNTLVVVD